jgi:ubiquinone/menaquinone biosynthesis C-methylase UbiE
MDMAVSDSKKDTVKTVYGEAAKAPAGLCCPQNYQAELLSHVPKEALDRNYGCGSPLLKAGVRTGEVVLDLGSGVGIDCFVAARMVGKGGKVIGVDMTDDMLEQANQFNKQVGKNLGYNVVEFRKGVIEQLPVADDSVDLVISNCVLNLSQRKDEVLKEILRVLRPGGRMVISDIVVDREIEPEDQDNETLWAECYTGAIPVGKLVGTYTDIGFQGLTQLAETPWRELEGYNFGSLTLRAFKLPKSTDCVYGGHVAVYLGPYASVTDEEDHVFPRFEAVEVCDATAARLRMGPYGDSFTVVDVPALARGASSCGAGGCGSGSSCGTDASAGSCGAGGCGPGSNCGTATAEPAAAAGRRDTPCCDPTDTVKPCCENNQPKADGSPCCDTYAVEQPAGCGCAAPTAASAAAAQAAAQAAVAKAASSSSCCDSGSSCGSGGGCGPAAAASPAAAGSSAAGEECCPCDTEAKATGSACCGSGCGTCGCS